MSAPPPSKPFRLGPFAALLTVILIVAFAVCTVTLLRNPGGAISPIVNIAIGVEIACIIGLIAFTVIAIARRNNPR